MVHYFSMVLVIWGLMIQPLMAAAPAKMAMNDHPVTQTLSDSRQGGTGALAGNHEQLALDQGMVDRDHTELTSSKMPCHETDNPVTGDTINKANSKPCDHCQSSDCASDCMSGSVCATSCMAFGTLMAMGAPATCVPTDVQSALFPYRSTPLLSRLPFRVFHPPKPA